MTVTQLPGPLGKRALGTLESEALPSPSTYCIYTSEGDQNLRKTSMKLQVPVVLLHSTDTAFKRPAFLLPPATMGHADQTIAIQGEYSTCRETHGGHKLGFIFHSFLITEYF